MQIGHIDIGKTYRIAGKVKNLLGKKVDVGTSWLRVEQELYNGGMDKVYIVSVFGDYQRSPLPWKTLEDTYKWLNTFLKECTICVDNEKAESRVRCHLSEAFMAALDEGFTKEHIEQLFAEYPKRCWNAEGGA